MNNETVARFYLPGVILLEARIFTPASFMLYKCILLSLVTFCKKGLIMIFNELPYCQTKHASEICHFFVYVLLKKLRALNRL